MHRAAVESVILAYATLTGSHSRVCQFWVQEQTLRGLDVFFRVCQNDSISRNDRRFFPVRVSMTRSHSQIKSNTSLKGGREVCACVCGGGDLEAAQINYFIGVSSCFFLDFPGHCWGVLFINDTCADVPPSPLLIELCILPCREYKWHKMQLRQTGRQ